MGGMTDQRRPPQLPHHRLVAYHVAVELLLAVKAAEIRDAKLRDEALRAAKSAVLNVAEGAGRVTRADKGRAFTIARGEASRRLPPSKPRPSLAMPIPRMSSAACPSRSGSTLSSPASSSEVQVRVQVEVQERVREQEQVREMDGPTSGKRY